MVKFDRACTIIENIGLRCYLQWTVQLGELVVLYAAQEISLST